MATAEGPEILGLAEYLDQIEEGLKPHAEES